MREVDFPVVVPYGCMGADRTHDLNRRWELKSYFPTRKANCNTKKNICTRTTTQPLYLAML